MQGPDTSFTPMLTRAESKQRKGRRIHGQEGGLSELSLHHICIYFEKKNLFLPSSDSPHPLVCPLLLGQPEGQASSRTFWSKSNPAEIDLEVLGPALSAGGANEDKVVKRAIILAVILFFLRLVAVVNNGFVTAPLGMEWSLGRALSPCDKLSTPESLRAPRFCPQWAVISKSFSCFPVSKGLPRCPGLQLPAGLLECCRLMVF